MKRPRLSLLIIAFSSPLAAFGASCALVDFQNVAQWDDAVDAGDAGDASAPACEHARAPRRPDVADPGGAIDFTVAVSSIDLGEDNIDVNGPPPPGLDLDDLCTNPPDVPNGCISKALTPSMLRDYEQGRDNAAAKIFDGIRDYGASPSFNSAGFSQKAKDGYWSLLLRVRGYDGEPDDPKVSAALYLATDLNPTQPGGPKWDGSDAWPVSSESVTGSDVNAPVFLDPNAYVSGNILVASFDEAQIDLPAELRRFVIKLHEAIVVAPLQAQNGAFRVEKGIIAGRWRIDSAFAAIDGYPIISDASVDYLCTQYPFYNAVKASLCGGVDTYSQIGSLNDNCDAISFGMGFSAEPAASPSAIANVPPVVSPCPPNEQPSKDTCLLLMP